MILGLCGPTGVGKTCLANELFHKEDFTRISFAKPLKDMLMSVLLAQGVSKEKSHSMLYGDLREKPNQFFNNKTPRFAMQTLGTEWGRNLMGENFWTNICINTILYERDTRSQTKFVIDDLRFLSEACELKKWNGRIIRIDRFGYEPGEHRSEREYLEIKPDLVVYNATVPEQMLAQVKAANFF